MEAGAEPGRVGTQVAGEVAPLWASAQAQHLTWPWPVGDLLLCLLPQMGTSPSLVSTCPLFSFSRKDALGAGDRGNKRSD